MRMTTAGFAYIFQQLKSVAPGEHLAIVTEGGYDLPALGRALDVVARVVGRNEIADAPDDATATGRGSRALKAVQEAQQDLWALDAG
jgi:acetoin utilization deacetylase AcuC-like enzyme